MTASVCFSCANEARASELEWIETPLGDRLEHIGDCPPWQDGYTDCRGCGGAYASLSRVEWVQPLKLDESGAWVERNGGRFVAAGFEPPARHVRVTRAEYETGLLDLLPAGTLGVALDGWLVVPGFWQDAVLCRDCLVRLGIKAQTASQGHEEPEAEDGFERIPTDGEWRSIEDTAKLAGFGLRNGKPLVRTWARDGLLEVSEQPTGAGGSNRKLYRRPVA